MSRGGFGRGGSAPRGRGGFSSSNRGGSYGGYAPQGPPDTVLAMGQFMHSCEGEMVCKSINIKIPYFNAPIYLENKKQIGKVDEILGPLNEVYFTVKLDHGVLATSFEKNDKVYIGGDKLLPVERFLPKPASSIKAGKPVGRQGMVEKRGGGRGGFSSRGSFGGSSRGSFAPRGQSSRGSFAPRGQSGRGSFAPRARGRGGY